MIFFTHYRGLYTLRKWLHYFSAFIFKKAPIGGRTYSLLNIFSSRKAFLRSLSFAYCTCLLLFGLSEARAQSAEGEIKPLEIGDTLPEALWNLPLQVVNHPEGKETVTLSEYKDKLIILDFWATWCAPCIKSLHKLDTLQKEFPDDLKVIPIGLEDAETVLPFFKKNRWSMASTTNSSINHFKAYLPHKAIPYQVWIRSNKIIATTFASQTTQENISKVIENGSTEGLSMRQDNLSYDPKKPLIFNANGGELNDVLYSSILTGYLDGTFGGGGVQTDSVGRRRLKIMNADIGRLYRTAASRYNYSLFFRGRMIVDEFIKQLIPDGNPQDQLDLRPYFYSYELITPVENDTILSHYAIEDLNRLFRDRGINGYIETREVPCYVFTLEKEQLQDGKNERNNLSATEFSDNNISFKNTPSKEVFSQIQSLFSSLESPLINEMPNSHLTFEIPNNKQNRSFREVREAMARQGIQIKKELRELEVIVIEKSI